MALMLLLDISILGLEPPLATRLLFLTLSVSFLGDVGQSSIGAALELLSVPPDNVEEGAVEEKQGQRHVGSRYLRKKASIVTGR